MIRRLGRWLHVPVIRVLKYLPWMSQVRVRAIIVNQQGQVLLIKSWLSEQRWTLPGGGVERHESREEAAARETHEETGLLIPAEAFRYVTTVHHPITGAELPIYYARVIADVLPPLALYHRLEIVDRRWFASDELPSEVTAGYQHAIALALTEKN